MHVAGGALVGQERDVDRAEPIHVLLGHAINPSAATVEPSEAGAIRHRRASCRGRGAQPCSPPACSPAAAEAPGSEPTPAPPGRFDAQRAFRDLRAQVRIGPRPAGSAASRREVRLIARRLREAGVREVRVQRPHRNVVAPHPGPRAGDGRRRRPPRHQGHPRLRRRQRRRLGRRGPARAGARPAAAPRRARRIDLVFFDAEEARGDRPVRRATGRGAASQFVRYARRGGDAGLAAAGRDPRHGPVRHGRRLRPRDPARGELGPRPLPAVRATPPGEQPGARRRSWARRPAVLDDHIPFVAGGDPGGRPDRLRLRPGPRARRLVAHAPGRPRPRLRAKPRRGGRAGARRAAGRSADAASCANATWRPLPVRRRRVTATLGGHGCRPRSPCPRAQARAARRAARLLRRRRPRRADGRGGARAARAAGLRAQGDRPQQARRRAARRARRDLRRGGDRGPGGRAGRLLRPRRGAEGARERARSGACARSTPPVPWSPRSTSRRASSPSRATRSS